MPSCGQLSTTTEGLNGLFSGLSISYRASVAMVRLSFSRKSHIIVNYLSYSYPWLRVGTNRITYASFDSIESFLLVLIIDINGYFTLFFAFTLGLLMASAMSVEAMRRTFALVSDTREGTGFDWFRFLDLSLASRWAVIVFVHLNCKT